MGEVSGQMRAEALRVLVGQLKSALSDGNSEHPAVQFR
jgi:hypothetical protein